MGVKLSRSHVRRCGWLLSGGLALAVTTTPLIGTTSAQAQYGPYTCAPGLVWREAVSGDYVCVTPQWREKTQEENRLGPSLVQPGGGPYGPDTCKPGFVWRETRPSDHVCVHPQVREDVRRGNANAYSGYAHPDQLPKNGTHAWWENATGQLLVHPAHLSFYGWEPGRGYLPRLSNYGDYYGNRAVTPANCQKRDYRYMYVLAVDATTGIVSNAGRVLIPQCLPYY